MKATCSAPSPSTEILQRILSRQGVHHFAVCRAGTVDTESEKRYRRWLEEGCNASMDYLSRHADLRSDPRLLLQGAQSVICCAVSYWHPQASQTPYFAAYALGSDYHEVLRRRLSAAAAEITEAFGGETRVCIDTAPVDERYWAEHSGLGVTGRNGCLIVGNCGSMCFLGEILTTIELPCHSSEKKLHTCGDCGKCIRACPTGALRGDGTVDARRCLSYLTIEHRGDFAEGTDLHGRLYGCDICAKVCPHNALPEVTDIAEFVPREEVVALTPEQVASMSQEDFSRIFTHSAVKRAKLEGLRRNARTLLSADGATECKLPPEHLSPESRHLPE